MPLEVGGEGHVLQIRLGRQVSDGMTAGGTLLSIQHRFHESQHMTWEGRRLCKGGKGSFNSDGNRLDTHISAPSTLLKVAYFVIACSYILFNVLTEC